MVTYICDVSQTLIVPFGLSVETTENVAVGTKVVQIFAIDNDQGVNKKVTYKIIGGNSKG